ncbi:MAG: AmmeMemoRadiSam system protein A, partial [Candidatus Aminicenantales bacterium]
STLLYARHQGPAKVKILKYSDTSQAGTPPDRVVGYLAAAVYLGSAEAKFSLTSSEKQELLQLARTSIEKFTLEKKVLNYQPHNAKLRTPKGVFVTIKKYGRLRGCIGFIEPVMPLYQAVIQAAIYAACRDPRFPPLSPKELKNLEIEISVLSPLKKISNPYLVTVGQHGLLISKGEKRGVLLPQVPVENHWSQTEFLEQACLKAGLPRDAWKHGANIFVFEAIVFP